MIIVIFALWAVFGAGSLIAAALGERGAWLVLCCLMWAAAIALVVL